MVCTHVCNLFLPMLKRAPIWSAEVANPTCSREDVLKAYATLLLICSMHNLEFTHSLKFVHIMMDSLRIILHHVASYHYVVHTMYIQHGVHLRSHGHERHNAV